MPLAAEHLPAGIRERRSERRQPRGRPVSSPARGRPTSPYQHRSYDYAHEEGLGGGIGESMPLNALMRHDDLMSAQSKTLIPPNHPYLHGNQLPRAAAAPPALVPSPPRGPRSRVRTVNSAFEGARVIYLTSPRARGFRVHMDAGETRMRPAQPMGAYEWYMAAGRDTGLPYVRAAMGSGEYAWRQIFRHSGVQVVHARARVPRMS